MDSNGRLSPSRRIRGSSSSSHQLEAQQENEMVMPMHANSSPSFVYFPNLPPVALQRSLVDPTVTVRSVVTPNSPQALHGLGNSSTSEWPAVENDVVHSLEQLSMTGNSQGLTNDLETVHTTRQIEEPPELATEGRSVAAPGGGEFSETLVLPISIISPTNGQSDPIQPPMEHPVAGSTSVIPPPTPFIFCTSEAVLEQEVSAATELPRFLLNPDSDEHVTPSLPRPAPIHGGVFGYFSPITSHVRRIQPRTSNVGMSYYPVHNAPLRVSFHTNSPNLSLAGHEDLWQLSPSPAAVSENLALSSQTVVGLPMFAGGHNRRSIRIRNLLSRVWGCVIRPTPTPAPVPGNQGFSESIHHIILDGSHQVPVRVAFTAQAVVEWLDKYSFDEGKFFALDVERSFSRSGGDQGKAAVLQLAGRHGCLIIQLLHIDSIPDRLKRLLADPYVKFAGVGVVDDFRKLQIDHGLFCVGAVELRTLAALGLHQMQLRRADLAELCAEVLHVRFATNSLVASSNWAARALSNNQVKYAAVDVFAAYRLLLKLKEKVGEYSLTHDFFL